MEEGLLWKAFKEDIHKNYKYIFGSIQGNTPHLSTPHIKIHK